MPPRDRTNRQLADIILGDCRGTTLDPELGDAIAGFFTDEGLSVAWNEPYAGGFITREHGQIGTANQSIQIEINGHSICVMRACPCVNRMPFQNRSNISQQ